MARGTRSIIDYIIANEKMWPKVMDTRVYRGAEIDTDIEDKFPKKTCNNKEKQEITHRREN
jgi:hypothetical protein